MPDFVKLINKGSKPFDFHQNNRKRILQPGEDAIVPWGLAVTLFGHPGMLNIAPRNERLAQYKKVRAKFNYTDGLVPPEALEQGIRDPEEWWNLIRPRIDVFDIETNEQIFMIIDDPEGEKMSKAPTQSSGSQDIEFLTRQVQALTEQINRLAQQQTSSVPDPAAGTTQSPTPTADGPSAHAGTPTADSFTIPVPTATAVPSPDDGAPPALDLSALVAMGAQVAADAPDPSPDSPQAVPTGDVPSKLPPRPGS